MAAPFSTARRGCPGAVSDCAAGEQLPADGISGVPARITEPGGLTDTLPRGWPPGEVQLLEFALPVRRGPSSEDGPFWNREPNFWCIDATKSNVAGASRAEPPPATIGPEIRCATAELPGSHTCRVGISGGSYRGACSVKPCGHTLWRHDITCSFLTPIVSTTGAYCVSSPSAGRRPHDAAPKCPTAYTQGCRQAQRSCGECDRLTQ